MSLIKKPSELQFVAIIKALLYGQPGIGKTTLALSAPAPLHLDFDRGIHRISPQHLKDTVPITCWEDVDNVLKEDLSAYSTLVVDTAGKMIEFMSEFIMRNDPRLRMGDGSLSLKGYGARKVMFKSFFSRVSMLGKNVVFVAHELEERDGDTRFVRPEIGGSSGSDLMKELDLVGYMEAVGKKRTISFDATEKYYGKNTCELPERIDVVDVSNAPNNLVSGIFTQYKAMLEKKSQMKGVYMKLLDDIDHIVENSDTVEKVNDAVVKLQNLEHIWDSKMQSAQRIHNKAKELGLGFNREQGVYVVMETPPAQAQPEVIPDREPEPSAEVQDALDNVDFGALEQTIRNDLRLSGGTIADANPRGIIARDGEPARIMTDEEYQALQRAVNAQQREDREEPAAPVRRRAPRRPS